MAANSEKKQPKPRGSGKRFAAGQSGNKAGRPAGSRNRASLAIDALLEGQAQAIGQKAVDLALEGDAVALRLCMDRVAPVRRGRPVNFALPALEGPSDIVRALGSILQAVADGSLTPDEASTIGGILDTKRRAIETTELSDRLAALEAKAA